jgi:hypothetical protein
MLLSTDARGKGPDPGHRYLFGRFYSLGTFLHIFCLSHVALYFFHYSKSLRCLPAFRIFLFPLTFTVQAQPGRQAGTRASR